MVKAVRNSCILLVSLMCSCVQKEPPEQITVFAGAGLTEPLSELAEMYKSETGVIVLHDFQGSGRLAAKIKSGQHCDLFIPASAKWQNMVGNDVGYEKTFSVARHRPVIALALPPAGITSLHDILNNKTSIALGDPEATAIGSLSRHIVQSNSISMTALNIKTYGLTVKQLVGWVENGSVESAIVWRADVYQNNKVRIIEIEHADRFTRDIPVCLFKQAARPADDYYEYLREHGAGVFDAYGFTKMQDME